MQRKNLEIMALATVAIAVCALASFAVFGGDDHDPTATDPDYLPNPIIDDLRDYPDAEEVQAEMDELFAAYLDTVLSEDADADEILERTQSLGDLLGDLEVWYGILMWDYSRDPSTYTVPFMECSSVVNSFDMTMSDFYHRGLDGPNADEVEAAMIAVFGQEVLDYMSPPVTDIPELEELLERELELCDMFYTSPSTPDNMAAIYLELIDVRNRIAELRGYENYTEYGFSMNNTRDYGPEDVAGFMDAVADRVVPLYYSYFDTYQSPEYYYGSPQQLFDDASQFFHSISEEFGRLYDCMVENDLIDFDDLPTKPILSYSWGTVFSDTRYAYICAYPYGGFMDVRVLVHEFGHAANYCLNPTKYGDYDIVEVHSQGLEALFALDPQMLDGQTEAVRTEILFNLLANMISTAMFAEFELRAFAEGPDTQEDLEALYAEVASKYGIEDWSPWYYHSQLFDSPFYSISYGVSAFNALDIFITGLEDRDAALDEYMSILLYDRKGYVGMTDALGIRSALDQDDFDYVIDAIEDLYAHADGVLIIDECGTVHDSARWEHAETAEETGTRKRMMGA